MRARALRAPSFLGSLPRQTGRCAPPAHRSFAASYLTQKNILNLSNLGRPRQGLFSFHRTTEAMKYEVPCPSPRPSQLRWSFSGNILGSKLCIGATIRPKFFRFSLFCIAFGSVLFVILFFLIYSYSSLLILLFLPLLILLVGTMLRLLLISSYILNCSLYYDMSAILRGFSRGSSLFWSIWGQN